MPLRYMEDDRALLAAKNAEILDLEAQISILRQKIAGSNLARKVVQERLQSYTYPVLSLPNEIVSEIFVHLLPIYPEPPPGTGRSSPLCLTHICRRWREIAISMPVLWRAIQLSGYNETSFDDAMVYLASLYGERSKLYPLSIDLWYPESTLSALIPYSGRWEHLDLKFGSRDRDITLENKFPMLRSLKLWAYPLVFSRFTIRDSPVLRHAVINSFSASKLTIPWAQLTTLIVRDALWSEWLPVFRHMVLLQNLNCVLQSDYDITTPASIRLPRLQCLDIDTVTASAGDIFLAFVLPALRRLWLPERFLHHRAVVPLGAVESLRSFISQSNCDIESLHVAHASVSEATYRREFPSIAEVVVCRGGFAECISSSKLFSQGFK
ncbi:F-box domain-containing protein [Favolaschia claudopus]|uniref:F-box domain-containing protein n=1 Tax=Favolaschia claudopus TaxID=2862362 RepID=A0AAW0DGD3_9AGAR